MKMILLTAEQADKVRGSYGLYSALDPIQVIESYALPVDVLDNSEFASVKEFLQTLPIQEVTLIETLPEIGEN
jgi:hypothetical protein